MGFKNMDKVMHQWGHLNGTAYKLLMRMARSSLDEASQPVSFLSRVELAMALGRMMPEEPLPEDASPEAEAARLAIIAHKKAVSDGIRELQKAGALSSKTVGRSGRRAEYYLHLDRQIPATKHEIRTPNPHENRNPMGYGNRAPSNTENVPPRTTDDHEKQHLEPKSPEVTNLRRGRRGTQNDERNRQLRALESLMASTTPLPEDQAA